MRFLNSHVLYAKLLVCELKCLMRCIWDFILKMFAKRQGKEAFRSEIIHLSSGIHDESEGDLCRTLCRLLKQTIAYRHHFDLSN